MGSVLVMNLIYMLSGVRQGEVGRMEAKLVSLGKVRGVLCGTWG